MALTKDIWGSYIDEAGNYYSPEKAIDLGLLSRPIPPIPTDPATLRYMASQFWTGRQQQNVGGPGDRVDLSWNQLSPAAQAAVTQYFTSTVLPKFWGTQSPAFLGGLFDTPESAYLMGTYAGEGNGNSLLTAGILYAADPAIAAQYGITPETLNLWTQQNAGMQAARNQTSDINATREGLLMAALAGGFGAYAANAGAGAAAGAGAGASDAAFAGGATGSAAPATAGVSTITPIVSEGSPTLLGTATGAGSYVAPAAAGTASTGLLSGANTAANVAGAGASVANAANAANTAANNPGMLGNAAGWLNNILGSNLTANELGNILGVGSGLLGSYIQGNAARDALQTSANAQIEAAKIAAEAAKFKPVGVTTRFGSSNFGFDSNGNLVSAGYSLSPDLRAQQDVLMNMAPGLLQQYQGAQAATAPMGSAAQRAMTLGQGYLATDPQAQAAKYYADQQALLAGTREQQLAELQNKLAAQGRLGLAVGGTSTGMLATNPEMAAYYNALQQQDLQLAANATQGGMDYAKFGTDLVTTGGNLLNNMYRTQQSAYAPYQTALGGAESIENLGRGAMNLGMSLGNTATAAAEAAGRAQAEGIRNAAQLMQQANAYSPWGNLLQGAGQAFTQYSQPYRFDPFTGQQIKFGV